MAVVEGKHTQSMQGTEGTPGGGRTVRYRATYQATGSAIHYQATFESGDAQRSAHEGQFDFDPSKLDAAAAVDAFMQNHIAKAGFDVAP